MTILLMTFSSIIAQEKLKTPPYLQVGDTIAIVAPAGILKDKQEIIEKAKQLAESWGLKVVLGKNLFILFDFQTSTHIIVAH